MNNVEGCLDRMQTIFNKVQSCDAKTYSELLRAAVHALSSGDALQDFCGILNTVLVCRRPSIPSKIAGFLGRVFEDVSETPGGAAFVLGVFSYLTRLTESRVAKARKNALFVLKLVIDIPQTKVVVTDGFLSKVCERLFDREKSVRREALRVLAGHQEVQLNPKIRVLNLFKDITRHDPNHEVRSFALHVISIEPSTYNCLIERCVDSNEGIRRLFYTRCLPRIDLRSLPLDRRVFLMEKAVLEREFDAKNLLLDALFSTFCLPDEIQMLCALFYDRTSLKCLETVLNAVFEKTGCELHVGDILADPSEENTFLAMVELGHVEEMQGRDSLGLPNLEDFVAAMYQSCQLVLEERSAARIEAMKNLFRIARFYDFFNEKARKHILGMVYKLLAKNSVEEVVEEAVQMSGLVCDRDIGEFVGSVISKNMSSSQRMCLMVCRQAMKHIRPFSDLHEAIVNEIVLPNLDEEDVRAEALEIGFYYVLERENETISNALFCSIQDPRVFHMCTDLVVASGNCTLLRRLAAHVENLLDAGSEDVVIPGSKAVLSQLPLPAGLRERLVEFALERYYSTADDHLKQYCTVFFYEMFTEDSTPLLETFCRILERLPHSQRTFIDQALYWIENSRLSNGSQRLFYNTCLHLAAGAEKRHFAGVLERIEPMGCWDQVLTKKILFCCSLLTRKGLAMGEVVGRLMEIDDGEPIDQKALCDVKNDLNMN